LTQNAKNDVEDNLRTRTINAIPTASLLVGILVPAFIIVDWFTLPHFIVQFGILRLSSALISLLCFLASKRKWSVDYAYLISSVIPISTSVVISIMCWISGGYESAYYQGILLVITGTGFLFPWPPRIYVTMLFVTFLVYYAPLVSGHLTIQNQTIFILNQFFILGFTIISSVTALYRSKSVSSEFVRTQELEKKNNEIHEANTKLQEIDKAKNQFFSNITHELRTPLTMILAPVETLLERRDNLTTYQVQSLNTIQSQALQVLKMINDLLDLAKIEENFLRLRIEEFDIHSLLVEIVTHSKTLAERNNLTMEFISDTEVHSIYCDPEKMERVFVNLISNAMKFTPEGGHVQIRLSLADQPTERLIVEVIDSGIGIPMDKQDAVFDRFVQADASITRNYGGTGIGLAFSYT